MRKIKIFRGVTETEINEWLAVHEAAIIHNVLQSESMNDGIFSITITIFYYEGEQGT